MALQQQAIAQITPDTTLPENSIVTPAGTTSTITGGTRPATGNNLFHSFSEFSVPTGSTAFFDHAADIQNIFTRVTGTSLSNIDGTLRANGTANLFLLNPNGILFGPNARLNIGGSFVGTTAHSIRFADNAEFSATNPSTSPLLSISAPIGLQMGQNPSPITVNNTPSTTGLPDILNPGLLVRSGNISLVGGNLTLNGARITALTGGLNLAAIAAPGSIDLILTGNAFQLGLPTDLARADISISNRSVLSLAAPAPQPSITIQARNLAVSERSSVLAFLSGFAPRGFQVGDMAIETTGQVTVNDSTVFTGSTNDARGIAGNLNITTAQLLVTGAARIGTTSLGPSTPGDTNITADAITVDGTGSRLLEGTATGIYSTNYSNLTTPASEIRNSGNINIRTRNLSVINGGFISASTFAPGDGGDLNITATGTILVEGVTPGVAGVASLIGSTVEADGIGNGGNVSITAPSLVLNQGGGVGGRVRGGSQGNGGNIALTLGTLEARNGGLVVATSQGTGSAGNVSLNVRDRILLTGRDNDYERRTAIFGSFSSSGEAASGIYTNLASGGTGRGGSIQIRAGELSLQDGAQISASTSGIGNAGNLEIRDTRLIEVLGTSSFDGRASSINAEVRTGAVGNGGNLSIATQQLRIADGGQVSASTTGQGNAGNIRVNANTVNLSGISVNGQIPSRLTTVTSTSGSSGAIAVETANLQVQNGAQIITDTESTGNAGNLTVTASGNIDIIGQSPNGRLRSGLYTTVEPGGSGRGGDLSVTADRLQVSGGGMIQAGTGGSGDSGNLFVRANQIDLSSRGVILQAGTNLPGGLSTAVLPQATGRGGNVIVEGDRLRITEGGQIAAGTLGIGNAGSATIRVANIEIQGNSSPVTVGSIPTAALNNPVLSRTPTPNAFIPTGIFTTALPSSRGNGGALTVISDRITLGNSGQIGSGTFATGNAGNLTVQANQVNLSGANTQLFASTNLGSRGNAGNIQVTAEQLQLRDGAQITTSTHGSGNAGNLTVRSRGAVSITGTAGNGQIPSGLLTQVRPGATGQGGDLLLESDRLTLRGGGQISTATFGAGNAGDLTLRANQIDLSGTLFAPTATNPFPFPGGISTSVFSPQATGNGGNLRIESDRLSVRNYAQVTSFTLGRGNAGNITVRSDQFNIIGQDVASINNNTNVINTGVTALGSPGSSGNSGSIRVVSDRLSIRDGGQITASTAGTGDGGDIAIRANQFDLVGGDRTTAFTGLFTTALGTTNNGTFTNNTNAILRGGNGGDIAITSDRLRILNGATIATGTFTSGDAGDLTIRADQIEIRGSSPAGFISNLATTVTTPTATGNGGDLRLDTNHLLLQDGGQINASTIGRGNAGSVRIHANTIDLSGVSANRPRVDRNRAGNASLSLNSTITAAATSTNNRPTGSAGSVRINTNTLQLRDRTTISVSNTTGSGNTGNLIVNANTVRLSDRASLQAEVSAGSQGNLRVNADLIAIGRQSRISTNAQRTATGGNIALRTQYLVATENSDITANAVNSFGGRVTVSAQGILGTEFRPRITPESDITAASERGAEFSGSVQLQTPNVQPGQGITQLPETVIDPNTQVANACAATTGNQFIITGRGGVPQNPEQILERDRTWADLRDLSAHTIGHTTAAIQSSESATATNPLMPPAATALQEATGWSVDTTGQVQLITLDRSQSQGVQPAECAVQTVSR